jgi:hypothetical protein
VKAAREAGLSREEVLRTVQEAEALRLEDAAHIADYARGLLGDGEKRSEDPHDPRDRRLALVRIGAAAGGNAGYLLERLLPRARGLGLSDEALKEALEMAGAVKKMAASVFDKDAERAQGRAEEVAAATEAAGYAGTAPADAEAREGERGRCCY